MTTISERPCSDKWKCLGRKENDPLFPMWHPECVSCTRRMTTIKEGEPRILPWTGHGKCPDQRQFQ